MDLVATAPDLVVEDRVRVKVSVASSNAKVCSHAGSELCTESDQVRSRGSYPYVDASVVSYVALEARVQEGGEWSDVSDGESVDWSQTDGREGNQYYHCSDLKDAGESVITIAR